MQLRNRCVYREVAKLRLIFPMALTFIKALIEFLSDLLVLSYFEDVDWFHGSETVEILCIQRNLETQMPSGNEEEPTYPLDSHISRVRPTNEGMHIATLK